MPPRNLRRCSSSSNTTQDAINDLRNRILLQIHNSQKYNANDVRRVKEDSSWLSAFLTSCNYDVDVAYAVVLECMRWRKTFDVEGISLLSLKSLLDKQIMFIHGKDRQGYPILWMNMMNAVPGEMKLEELFVFWMERNFGEALNSEIVIIIDMTGTKLKNMDLNFMKFVLRCTKYYYPTCVRRMYIYESPPILNALWKVVKSWIDVGYPSIDELTIDTISHIVDPEDLQPHQGGSNAFHFTMNDIARYFPLPAVEKHESKVEEKADLDSVTLRRNVKFDEGRDESRPPLVLTRRSSKGPGRRLPTPLPPAIKPIADKRIQAEPTEWAHLGIVAISPKEELLLTRTELDTDYVDIMVLKNCSENSVMFKIKTTSPEKFRVRPSTGIIASQSSEIIRVHLQNEYRFSSSKEKLLIVAMETEETNIEEFSNIWKATDKARKVEYKMKCKIPDEQEGLNMRPERRSSLLTYQKDTIEKLQESINQLANTQRLLIVVVGVLFAIIIVVMLYENSNYHFLKSSIATLNQKQDGSVAKDIDDEL